ncbi:MAG: amidase [Pseudomonadota bacterium]
MSETALCLATLTELADKLRTKAISPVELTRAYLSRIERLDVAFNSYIVVDDERALDAAKVAEREIVSGQYRGPLHGMPVAYKDIVDVAGLATTCASGVLEDNIATTNATVVERLEQAGAITLGKLNMNEFATLLPSERFGPVVNPWSAHHSPGGSSSGSGSAVAAGLCAGALGTDTGGSIRIPAAFNGIVGLKQTFGRVSNFGVVPLAWSLDHIGPMTRSVRDAAVMLETIAGHDPRDVCSLPDSPTDYVEHLDHGVNGLRVGVPKHFFDAMTATDVGDAVSRVVEQLQHGGARITSVSLPTLDSAWDIANRIISAEASAWHEVHLHTRPERYGTKVRKFLTRASDVTASDYARALREKAALRRDMLAAQRDVDVMLTPGTLIAAPALEDKTVDVRGENVGLRDALVSPTVPFNLSGQPALTVPMGFTTERLPVAIQIVGGLCDEATVLRVGAFLERAVGTGVPPDVE